MTVQRALVLSLALVACPGPKENPPLSLPPIPPPGLEGPQVHRSPGPCPEGRERAESDSVFLDEIYRVLWGRAPEGEDHLRWMNILSQGASREGIYRALILNGAYGQREKQDIPAGGALGQFAALFLKNYTGRPNYTDNLLAHVNFYALKRTLAEEALGVLDRLGPGSEPFSSWYGVFSDYLARDFQALFDKENHRGNPDALFHRDWAKKSCEQWVKSEVLVKLHRVLNHLGPL